VWKGIHKKTKEVRAVKKVPIEDNIQDLLKEIQHMKELDSPYIVAYCGSYLTDNILWVHFSTLNLLSLPSVLFFWIETIASFFEISLTIFNIFFVVFVDCDGILWSWFSFRSHEDL
jgi:serine/threonine protein kinase